MRIARRALIGLLGLGAMALALYDNDGQLLTNQLDFNVIVDPQFTADYNTPNYVYLKGETSLQDYLAKPEANNLAKTDLDVDLQNGTLKAADDAAKPIVSVNCKSISISNGKVTGTGLNLKAADGVSLSNVEIDGAFAKANSNASVSINTSGDVVVDGVKFTNADAAATGRYNGIEINLGKGYSAKNVTIKNSSFAGLSNNAILVFGMPEEGVVNVENCQFDLADGGEALRISNKDNTKHFTVNVKDCNYTYPTTMAEGVKIWYGFFLFEDNDKPAATYTDTYKPFSGINIVCDNVTFAGTKVNALNLGTNDHSQFACMCYDNCPTYIITDASHFPTFTFK